jgi:hypothetical protein
VDTEHKRSPPSRYGDASTTPTESGKELAA